MKTTLKDITIRLIQDEDFAEVSEWFTKRKWPVPPAGKMLPESGFVAEQGGKLLSVAWLYVTNSQVGIIDWIATSPDAGSAGIISVKRLIDHIEEISVDTNVFMTFVPSDKFAQYLKKKCRFKITEQANVCVRRREAANG